MSTIKDQAIDLIQSLPDDCSLEDIQYHLYVREKVERGLRAIDEGRFVTQDEAEQQVAEWLRSSGQGRH
jgi:predicted transcriptional regulator